MSGFARIPSHKCPRCLVMGRWWTELEPAARGLIEAQVAWGEAYVGVGMLKRKSETGAQGVPYSQSTQ